MEEVARGSRSSLYVQASALALASLNFALKESYYKLDSRLEKILDF